MPEFELVLDSGTQEEVAPAVVKSVDLAAIEQETSDLTPEERKQVNDFVAKIDIHDSAIIARYGESAQAKSSQFSESALAGVKAKDLDVVGDKISELVVQIRGFKPAEEKSGFFKALLQRGRNIVAEMQTRYEDVSANIDRICDELQGRRMSLLVDIGVLDKLFESNLQYFKELKMYIAAGKQKLEEVRNGELVKLREKAAKSGAQEDAQRVSDLEQQCDRFDKRIYDLELTRTICMQMAPQIRMIQGTNAILADKIQSSIVNTIPLWKNQILLTLGLQHSKLAIEAQRQVTDITNQILRENADQLKQSTTDAAREAERGIVDIETLVHTNEQLISTIDEVLTIRDEGYKKRREAEKQLVDIDNQLKVKMLAARNA